MKKINTIIFILLLMTVVNFASAETNHREEDRAVLKGYLSKFEQALNDNDIEQVTPL